MADSRTPGSNTLFHLGAKLAFQREGALDQIPLMDQKIRASQIVEDDPAPTAAATRRELEIALARGAPSEIVNSLRQKLSAALVRESDVGVDPDLAFRELEVARAQPLPTSPRDRQAVLAQMIDLETRYQTAAKLALDQQRLIRPDPLRAYQVWREALLNKRSPLMTEGLLEIFKGQAREPIDATFLAKVAEDAFRRGKTDLLRAVYGPEASSVIQLEIRHAAETRRSSAERRKQIDDLKARNAPTVLITALQGQLDNQIRAESGLAGKLAPPPAPTQAPAPRPASDVPFLAPAPPEPPAPPAPAPIEAKPTFLRELLTAGALLSPAILALIVTHKSD